MSSFLKYSLLNPIRFYQVGKNDLWTKSIPWFEWQTNYYQKFREEDNIKYQLLCTDPGLIIDLRVNNVVTGAEVYQDAIFWSHYSLGTPPYYVYQWNGQLLTPGYPIPDKMLLQIVLTIPAPQGNIILKSEYIYLYPQDSIDKLIENARLITVSHNENDFDYLWINQDGNATGDILLRIEGGFKSDGFMPGGKYTMYQDLQYKPVILQAIPYNSYRFTIGDNYGVPNWMADKLNRIFACSTVKIDGEQYCRNEGAKFEQVNRDPLYPSGVWVIDLLKSENPYSDEFNYVEIQNVIDFTADTTLVSADDEEITIDQETI